MANDDDPRGLIPLNLNAKNVHYYVVNTGHDIYIGQPVAINTEGFVRGGSGVTQATLLGVAVGFAGVNKAGLAVDAPFLDVSKLDTAKDGSGDRYVAVADDPAQEFIVQEDTGGTALVMSNIPGLVDDVFRGTALLANGNSNTGWCNIEIDADTISTDSTASYQILRLHDNINTDGSQNAVGDYAKWIVRIYHHQKLGGQQNVTAF